MCVCVCVCVCLCIYIYIYIYICICVYIYVYSVYVYIYMYIYVYVAMLIINYMSKMHESQLFLLLFCILDYMHVNQCIKLFTYFSYFYCMEI